MPSQHLFPPDSDDTDLEKETTAMYLEPGTLSPSFFHPSNIHGEFTARLAVLGVKDTAAVLPAEDRWEKGP